MRLSIVSGQLLTLATVITQTATASWIPDLINNFELVQNLEKRCDNPCGYYGQLCCQQGETCYTDAAGQAQCGVGGGNTGGQNGQWQYYTTTYVQTDLRTVTTVFSSFVPAATPPPTNNLGCAYANGESACGTVCCHAGQYCQKEGTCLQVPGGSSGYYNSFYTITTVVTQTLGPGIRPTTETILTLTSTGAVTGTAPFQTASGTNGASLTGPTEVSSGGLSGGAIAGIVIGVIAFILILLLICLCCCAKGLLDTVLGIFGLGGRKKRRTEETYIEERHSRHSGAAAGRTWFGTKPGRNTVVEEKEKKSSGVGRFLSVGAALGGLALLLGLKRRRERDNRSESSYTYGTGSYTSHTSTSSSSRSRSRSRGASRYSRR